LSHGLSTEQAIKNIYLFVRDQIKWTVEGLKPAIEVLRGKKGVCFNKASLQIALLRPWAYQLGTGLRRSPCWP
jgi:transglutaminase-like putative cysteine protease